ncbi:hypothetical protein [Hyphomonas sp. BRH_c22]|uniref:hypothetical protein n=1 Tax=Hyphomonas sp. BRH_c22 TaxID=1629710 RepID=UPI000B09884C|nr:hypothetical protein [Hyphomonas sp. BRH_c22]
MYRALISSVMFGLTGCANAQTPPDQTPPPSCSSEAHHAFDFWLGAWEVTDTSGNVAGDNVIAAEEGGCLLVERWTSASGGTGQSYNYLDPATGKWRQLWVSKGAVIDYSGGLTETGSMKLEGEIAYQSSGKTAPFTGEWTLNRDGSVTQHFEQYNADTDSWDDWFTGVYVRKVLSE